MRWYSQLGSNDESVCVEHLHWLSQAKGVISAAGVVGCVYCTVQMLGHDQDVLGRIAHHGVV